MKTAELSKTDRGGFKIEPPQFGNKLEIVARGCGHFEDGDRVVVLDVAHDTKPDEPRRGVRFVRVRHLTDQELLELAEQNGRLYRRPVINEITEDGTAVFGKITEAYGKFVGSAKEIGRVSANLIVWTNTVIHTRKDGETEPKWIRPADQVRVDLNLGVGIGGGQYQIVGQVHPTGWKLIEEACLAFGEKCRLEQEEGARRQGQREKTLMAKFMEEHPEAKNWFKEEPNWHQFTDELVHRKTAKFSRSVKSGHYASFSKEFDSCDHYYAVKIGEEVVEFRGSSTVNHIDGED